MGPSGREGIRGFPGGSVQDTVGPRVWGKEMRLALGKEETARGGGEKHVKKTAKDRDQQGPTTSNKSWAGGRRR